MSTPDDAGKVSKASQDGKDGKDPWSKENKNKFQKAYRNCKKEWGLARLTKSKIERRKKEKAGIFW
ncbi:hypothetical protein PG999_005829 [Apiospora kogelbergensis]|uniref:Uncharacterized protein n=1 Tax=Apiospora kogelbergensis TaxID=1337665 RepID=A0AAW0QPP6_9PEZI